MACAPPKLSGKKGFQPKNEDKMKILNRNEMRSITAGFDGWYTCSCYSGSFGSPQGTKKLGSVTCSSDSEQLTCCQVQYEETTATICSNSDVGEA